MNTQKVNQYKQILKTASETKEAERIIERACLGNIEARKALLSVVLEMPANERSPNLNALRLIAWGNPSQVKLEMDTGVFTWSWERIARWFCKGAVKIPPGVNIEGPTKELQLHPKR